MKAATQDPTREARKAASERKAVMGHPGLNESVEAFRKSVDSLGENLERFVQTVDTLVAANQRGGTLTSENPINIRLKV